MSTALTVVVFTPSHEFEISTAVALVVFMENFGGSDEVRPYTDQEDRRRHTDAM
jgi:hypothetical protein